MFPKIRVSRQPALIAYLLRRTTQNLEIDRVGALGIVAFAGVEVLDIDVQVQMGSGLPAFAMGWSKWPDKIGP